MGMHFMQRGHIAFDDAALTHFKEFYSHRPIGQNIKEINENSLMAVLLLLLWVSDLAE